MKSTRYVVKIPLWPGITSSDARTTPKGLRGSIGFRQVSRARPVGDGRSILPEAPPRAARPDADPPYFTVPSPPGSPEGGNHRRARSSIGGRTMRVKNAMKNAPPMTTTASGF